MGAMPDPIVFVLILLFGGIGAWMLAFPGRVLALFAEVLTRHRITTWLFFKDPLRVRITGLMYLGAAAALLVYRSQP
jgi:hypothetical protein